jgi:microcin C transport system substrate-binding protein
VTVTRNRKAIVIRVLGLSLVVALALGALTAAGPALAQGTPTPAHALAMHGDLKYPADYTNFEYVNADAPKTGEMTLGVVGTYNKFQYYSLEGDAMYTGVGRFYETLLESSSDEAFSEYCLLCETVTMPEDRSWVEFKLRPEAKWSDGTPVTADDVIYSYNIIKEKGDPYWQQYWASVIEAVKVDDQTIHFNFDPAEKQNRELPLITGQLPVFQQAWWKDREFDIPSVDVPVSSGPYKIVDVKPGTSFVYERDPNYWGKDLPINKGRFNFDRMKIDYYGDPTVVLEAFKAGDYDWRYENSSKQWATGYEFPALEQGLVTKELIPNESVNGMQGFVMNQRRPLFTDAKVREALGYAFDFEWSNKNLFYDQYTRTKSYWDNSELANPGGVPTGKEAAFLAPYKADLPPEVYTTTYAPPSTGGTEDGLRANLEKGIALLAEAGWTIDETDSLLKNAAGEQFTFEILLDDPAWERITQPYIDNLKRMGITASIRMVDPSQYTAQTEKFDYDMVVYTFGMSPSPGNEQRGTWTCASKDEAGSRNYAGVCNKAIDALVENVVQARSRDDLVTATHALDRALLWSFLVVPHWHIGADRVAYWNVISRPDISPAYGIDLNSWFYNAEAATAVEQGKQEAALLQATVEAAGTAGITPPTPLPLATVAPTEAMTTTGEAAETETEGGGGSLTGPLGLGLAVLVAIVAIVWFARRGRKSE